MLLRQAAGLPRRADGRADDWTWSRPASSFCGLSRRPTPVHALRSATNAGGATLPDGWTGGSRPHRPGLVRPGAVGRRRSRLNSPTTASAASLRRATGRVGASPSRTVHAGRLAAARRRICCGPLYQLMHRRVPSSRVIPRRRHVGEAARSWERRGRAEHLSVGVYWRCGLSLCRLRLHGGLHGGGAGVFPETVPGLSARPTRWPRVRGAVRRRPGAARLLLGTLPAASSWPPPTPGTSGPGGGWLCSASCTPSSALDLPPLLSPSDDPVGIEQRRQRQEQRRQRTGGSKPRPILIALKAWLDEQRPKALPKSPLGQAIGYALNNWTARQDATWSRVSGDRQQPLSERTLRAIALGRNKLGRGRQRNRRSDGSGAVHDGGDVQST